MPRVISSSFSFRPTPSPRLFPICLFRLVPPPSGSWEARADVDLRLRAAVGLLARHRPRAALSLIARSLFLVGLRAGASLRAGLRRRLCCRVVSYSIPDDVMRITGSCDIRLVAHPACLLRAVSVPWGDVGCGRPAPRAVERFASPPPCLLDAAAVPRRFARSSRSACSPRLSCRQAGRPRLAAISSCVPPTAPACLLATMRPAHPRGAAADVIAPFLRSVVTVPPLPRLAYSPRLFVSRGGEISGDEIGSDNFFLWDFCEVGRFSWRACAIMYAVAMGASEWEAFVPRPHKPHLLTGGVVRLLLLINTASPLLPILVVPLFLIAPPFYTIGGAISFCLLIITIYPPRACLSRLGFADRYGCCCVMPSSYPCGCLAVFCGFHTGPLACPSRRASSVLPLHGTPLVMSSVPIAPLIVSPYVSHRPSPRHPTR